MSSHAVAHMSGITSPHPQVIALRVLAHHAEDVMQLFKQVRAVWRKLLWDLPDTQPRIWTM
jgi:urease accessory protein